MKKFVSIALAIMMTATLVNPVSARSIKDTLGGEKTYDVPMTVTTSAKKSGSSEYSSNLTTYESSATLANGVGFDYQSKLDMAAIRNLFQNNIITNVFDEDAKAEFEGGTVSSTITVTVTYPAGITLNGDITAIGSLDENSKATFEEVRRDNPSGENKLKITYKNADGLKVSDLKADNYKRLSDITFTLENAVSYNATGTYGVDVELDGTTEITFESGKQNVHYYGNASCMVNVLPQTISTGGGGVSTYTVNFNTNGGKTIKSQSVKKNATATEPAAPEKEGYTFGGWFADKDLTEKYDFATKVTQNITLYAKWIENEPSEPGNTEKNVFIDVSEDDWFANDVKYVFDNNLMNGVEDNVFAPNSPLTRAMLVTILYRADGEPAVNKSIPFDDVDMGEYYANAVIWAKQNGIVSGHTETEFAPNENITREQIAAIMHRYAKYKSYDVTVGENTNILSYDDAASVSEYAVSAMQYAVGSGLMTGRTDSTLNPKDNTTRAEISAILHRFFEAHK